MKKGTIIAIIAAAAVLVVLFAGVGVFSVAAGEYNTLVTAEAEVDEKAGTVDVMLTRRADLIPNLVSTVKAYAKHETEVYTAIADARAKLAGSTTIEDKAAANSELDSALSRLLVVVEQYPELKASEQFIALQDQLEGSENRISTARTDYNNAVKTYNTKLRTFPSNLIAGLFGFEARAMYQADPADQDAPVVDFE